MNFFMWNNAKLNINVDNIEYIEVYRDDTPNNFAFIKFKSGTTKSLTQEIYSHLMDFIYKEKKNGKN